MDHHNHHQHSPVHAKNTLSKPHAGHDHSHHDVMIVDFKRRFWISTALTVPILALSPMIQQFFGLEFSIGYWPLFGLSSLVFFFGGWPFLTGMGAEIRKKSPGMMTLIGVAIGTAYIYSAAVVFGLAGKMFFWELATLVDIMLLGHWIEMKSVLGASRALELLVKLLPAQAHRLNGDRMEDVDIEHLNLDDLILIKPGEKIPADGIVIEGLTYVDESMLTGESKPVKKESGMTVIAGSINSSGSLQVKVKSTGSDSYLNKVITMVQDAQKVKSRTQHLADRAARWLTYIALAAGVVTFIVWLSVGETMAFALERMVTVMVISCPHALGLAVPLVVAISTTVAARNGLLIRNRSAFENSRRITAMVFDKTGTLTEGKFGVTRMKSYTTGLTNDALIRLAAAVEQHSEHPIASAIVAKARSMNLDLPTTENFTSTAGSGVSATVEGHSVRLVGQGYLKDNHIEIPESAFPDGSETMAFVLMDERWAGFIALADSIRPEAYDAIGNFKKLGIKVVMATGDNKSVAETVARTLGLDGFFADIRPHEKVEIVKTLQSEGHFVAMTGDGINDAPALAQANVGIAVGSGTDVAAETADIILAQSNPAHILRLILFGRATYSKMIQNLAWATGYNAIAIPLAAGIAYATGFLLSPAVGAALMSVSTVVVAINAQLLRRSLTATSSTQPSHQKNHPNEEIAP